MSARGPLVTLFGALGLGLVLLVANMHRQPHGTPGPAAQAVRQAPSSSGTTVIAPTPSTIQVPTSAPATVPPVRFPASGTYVGWTIGREASVAIAVKGTAAVAYLCDNQAVESWMSGTATGGKVNLTSPDNDRLAGALQGNRVSGTVWVAGHRWQFSTQIVGPPAGLYRADATIAGVQTRVSWIVQQNKQQSGLASGAGGTSVRAPELDTTTGKARVGAVTVNAVGVDGTSRPSNS
jgi:hypothetical protein